jgi:hypothetical protein
VVNWWRERRLRVIMKPRVRGFILKGRVALCGLKVNIRRLLGVGKNSVRMKIDSIGGAFERKWKKRVERT